MNEQQLKMALTWHASAHPDLRRGQAAFNAIHALYPEVANALRGSPVDPYYADDRVDAFIRRCAWRISALSGKRTDLLTLAQSVRPEALAGFLRNHGWTEQPARSPQICRFVLDGLTVLLPVNATGADYAKAMLWAVQVAAQHEGYNVADVLVQVGDLAP